MGKNVAITDSYLNSVFKLGAQDKKATLNTVKQLAENPMSPSLHIHAGFAKRKSFSVCMLMRLARFRKEPLMKPSVDEVLDFLHSEKEISSDYPWSSDPGNVSAAEAEAIADLAEELGGGSRGIMDASDIILGKR